MLRLRLRSCLAWLSAGFILFGCSTPEPNRRPPHHPGVWANSPAVCPRDQVRQYYCDSLLPRSSAFPAPAPFGDCPGVVEHPVGEIEPTPPVALFDSGYTRYTRERLPPGNACCYSWCSPLAVADPSQVAPAAGCQGVLAMHEQFCVDTPESGTSEPGPEPFARCPVAIKPPEGAVFHSPKAAPLNLGLSAARRQRGFDQCCYAWCSEAPGATGVQNDQPAAIPP